MVLGGEDDLLHSRGLHNPAPLVGIELIRAENRGVFLSRAPFAAGKGVDSEVDEADEFKLLPGELPRRRLDVGGFVNEFSTRRRGVLVDHVVDADVVNGEVNAADAPSQDQPYSVEITLPPLAALFLKRRPE